jgi:hypothetical protein
MATRQPQQATPPPVQAGNVTVTIPTSITLKDVVVIVTAIITIVSSWTFYTMRLSVQESKVAEFNVKMEKVSAELEAIRKDSQEQKMRLQALEIRQSLGKK